MPPAPRSPSCCSASSPISSSRSGSSAICSSVSAYSRPRNEKYTSNTVSNTRQWAAFFTSVAPSAYLNASRSSRGTCCTAAIASRFSVRLTGRPAVRSSTMTPDSSSVSAPPEPISVSRWLCSAVTPSGIPLPGLGGARASCSRFASQRRVLLELLGGLGDVALVLEEDVCGAGGGGGVDLLDAEQKQRARPVERLRHRGRLLQLELADRADDARHLVGQVVGDARHLGQHDLALAVEVGVVDVQEQAAPLEGLGQLTGVVGCEEHQGDLVGLDCAQLRDRYLVVGQDLEKQRLGLDLDPVDLVDEQHHRLVGADGLEQWAGEQELVGEDVVLELLPGAALVALGLDAEQLLLVVPLVQRLGLVQPFVALQPDETGAGDLGHRLGELRLAGACWALDEHRLTEAVGKVDDAGDALVGQVVDLAQRLAHGGDGLEAVSRIAHWDRLAVALTRRSTDIHPA